MKFFHISPRCSDPGDTFPIFVSHRDQLFPNHLLNKALSCCQRAG